ncbi:alpha/beta hydrolase fold protein [Sinorhizobium meliloti CCNWSX0020]|uniref:Alpha/beta hydrolase fold protein n=1 Tax=Sinorhizobium meliloti CCNWSX0020 TaxID=1107881 RepID=H0FU64_RHIML|nr:alpha/beta hydrolase [Sinorhizobium meliloti]EHK79395.1 alpha/beta hydrolase fold protein [Sinorhizobium meliloti CCNWSX0020]
MIGPHLPADFRLIAPDLRGHGQSDKPEGCYTIPEMAHDIRLLIHELGLAPVHLVGHSLGGRLAQALAERWPEVVRRMVLMSTSAAPREREGWLWENILALRDPIDPEGEFVREWCSTILTPIDEAFLSHVRRECASVPARVWRSIHYEQLAYDPAPLLQDIAAPTLILRGEKDEIATEEHQNQLKGGIIGSRLISLPDHGHNMHWEDAATLARLVGTFLRES